MSESFKQHVLNFGIPAAIWFAILGIVRYLHRPFGLDFDGAEQSYLSQWFELGSGIQPPLPSWAFHIVFDVFGYSVAWVHCLRLSLIFLIYLGFFKLSLKLIKSPVLSLMTTLSLVFIFQFSSVMLMQMHTVFITLAVIYSWLCVVNISEKDQLKSFIWLGFFFGVGFLSKYNFFIHALALGTAVLVNKEFREKFIQPRILLSIAIAFTISFPHYFWLLENLDSVRSGISNDMTEQIADSSLAKDFLKGFSELLLKTLSFTGVLIFVFLAFFYRSFKSNLKRKEAAIFKLMGYYMFIAYLILFVVILLTGATKIHEHWLQPFIIIFPILLFQKLKGSEDSLKKKFRVLKVICLSLFFIISIDFSLKSYIRLYTGHPASVFNIPYKIMADFIEEYASDCEIIYTQNAITAGHMKMILPGKLVLVYDDINHIAMEKKTILSSDESIFIFNADDDQIHVPFSSEFIDTALKTKTSFDIRDVRFERFNYVLTDKRDCRIGFAKITIGTE
ncbi:MAG: hypothetical protein HKN92_05785 [Chitinophagales bacterium]|nr:hypothetical protein [Chitinophagales bacterium]